MTDKDSVTLSSGRFVHITELRQYSFYEGVLEGVPTREENLAGIARLLEREQHHWGYPPFLIQPTEQLRDPTSRARGVPAVIPKIACVARFTSFKPARDPNADSSELVVLWFQHEFAFPIADDILNQLHQLPWDRAARDFEW